MKTEFSGPGNAVWQFGAYNPNPGQTTVLKLGSLKRQIAQAGHKTVTFKLKASAKTKRLFKKVRRLQLKRLQIKVIFTSGGVRKISIANVKLKLNR